MKTLRVRLVLSRLKKEMDLKASLVGVHSLIPY